MRELINKKNILICGFPNTVLRIFIENLKNDYNIFFVSYNKGFQYSKIKEILGKNFFLIDIESTKNVFEKFYLMLRFVCIIFKIAFKERITTSVLYHNHCIKNGIIILLLKWFFPLIQRVYFPYDIIFYAIPKTLRHTVRNRLLFFFDQICFEKCDKVITKGFDGELEYLKSIYKIHEKPHFVFNFLIEREDVINKEASLQKKDNKIHLVSVGGIKNPVVGDNNYIVIKELLKEKGILFHVYSHSSDLLKTLEHNMNLLIHNYVTDHNKLIKELSDYDFGVSLSCSCKQDLIQAKMASGVRIYDYLTAGLPVIIDSEHTSMANMIAENNFGIVISSKDIKNIINYIYKCDYSSMISSIKKNREKYFVETHINKLITFLDS